MDRLLNKKIYFFILVFSAIVLPHSIFASTVYIDTSRSNFFVDDTILFSVRIDSENKNINAVEGQILLDHAVDGASLTDINTAGSKFSLWPGNPLPSERNTYISFAGGAPGGFVSKNAIIFNGVLKLHKTGPIALSPNNIEVYLHDGKGTKDEVRVKNLIINVLPKEPDAESVDEWNNIISSDTTAPEPFEIIIGKDPSIFDNQYFISFFTSDSESGVAYYEVQEGERDFIRTESPYVLQGQSLRNVIKVKAVDKAGNERIEEVMPSVEEVMPPAPAVPFYKNILFWIVAFVIIVIVIAIFYVFWRNVRRKRKTQNESR